MKKKLVTLTLGLVAMTAMFTSCKKDEETTSTPTPSSPTLYERVGGTAKIEDPKNAGVMIEKGRLALRSVVDSAIFVIAADPKMEKFFPVLLGEVGSGNLSGFTALSKNFTDFLCVATGAKNFTYSGKNMKDAHNPDVNKRMGASATNADFDAFVQDIGIALGKNGVTDSKLIGDLVALLETTRADIVQTPSLYQRVGGSKLVADPANSGQMIEQGRLTLRSVVDSAIFVIAGDPQMEKFFGTLLTEVGNGNLSGFTALSKNFTDFLCVATGSKTFAYAGKSMRDAHDPNTNARMGVKAASADFDQFLADVGTALGQNGVTDQQLINDLVALLNTTRADIVQK